MQTIPLERLIQVINESDLNEVKRYNLSSLYKLSNGYYLKCHPGYVQVCVQDSTKDTGFASIYTFSGDDGEKAYEAFATRKKLLKSDRLNKLIAGF